jgi:hypothetical protein
MVACLKILSCFNKEYPLLKDRRLLKDPPNALLKKHLLIEGRCALKDYKIACSLLITLSLKIAPCLISTPTEIVTSLTFPVI